MKHHQHSLPGIYRITRISDGKVYIGKTTRKVGTRWTEHKRELNKGMHGNWPLQEAWLLGEPDDFEWDYVCQPLPGFTPQDLTDLEFEVMSNYPDRFNLNEPIQVYLGAHASTRAKLSKFHKALWEDPEFQAKVSAAQVARMADPETRAKNLADLKAMRENPEIEERRKRGAAEAWQREDVRAAQGAKVKAHWQDPEHRAKQEASRKAAWTRPEVRESRAKGMAAAWDRLTPEEREARATAAAAKHRTPEGRAAQAAKMREVWARRKAAKAAAQPDLWDGEVL